MTFMAKTFLRNVYTLQEITVTYPPDKAILKMIFLFPRWDMLVPWRVYLKNFGTLKIDLEIGEDLALNRHPPSHTENFEGVIPWHLNSKAERETDRSAI